MAFCFDVHIKVVRKMEIYIYIMIYIINKGTCLMARVMLGGDDNGARGRRFGASIFGDG